MRSHGKPSANSLSMAWEKRLHLISYLGDQMLLRNIPRPADDRTPLVVWPADSYRAGRPSCRWRPKLETFYRSYIPSIARIFLRRFEEPHTSLHQEPAIADQTLVLVSTTRLRSPDEIRFMGSEFFSGEVWLRARCTAPKNRALSRGLMKKAKAPACMTVVSAA